MPFRIDNGRLGKAERTPQGGIRVEAAFTRTGVFEYRRSDGTIQRELRHPDHVFAKESLDTLQDATLTRLHPSRVTAKDYKRLSIGHARDPQREDGEKGVSYVKGLAVVQDAAAVEEIATDKLAECSCGYTCDVVTTPGEYNGEKYDCIQTNIRYNHVAIGPRNWGRAGSTVALRLDAAGDMVFCDKDDGQMETELIDGIKYTVGSPEHVQALRKQRDGLQGRADGLQTQLDAANTRADSAEGERDTLRTERADADDPTKLDALVNERLELRTKACTILGKDAVFTRKDDKGNVVSLTSREVMVMAITHTDPTFKADGLSADYIKGRFAGLQIRKDSRASFRADADNALNGKGPDGQPIKQGKSIDQKRKDANENLRKLGTQPLTLSKQA